MQQVYQVIQESELTLVRFSGQPSLDDVQAAICEVAAKTPCNRRLWVLDKGLDLSGESMQRLASFGDKMFDLKSKVAIVANNDLAYGLSRIFGSVREQRNTTTRVFRGEEEARAWLRSKNNP